MADDQAVTLAAVALHDAECSDRHCSGPALGSYYKQARIALGAAAEAIRADERDRLTQFAQDREGLGELVRRFWVDWAAGQPDPKPSWLTEWGDLDEGQREVDMRIGAGVAAAERERIWSEPVAQRLELHGGYPGSVWRCAGCLAELTENRISHKPRCSEMGMANLIAGDQWPFMSTTP